VKLHRSALAAVLCLLPFAAHAADGDKNVDPFEGYNRAMFSFNDGVDHYFLKPLAQGYDAGVPLPARVAFTNFIANFGDVPNAFNDLLQGKVTAALTDVGRILINSTLGIAGAIDVASEFGLAKHDEDFGQTLGVWGFGTGPYLVLPLLGPSTVRDTIGLPVDYYSDVRKYAFTEIPVRNSITGVDVIAKRASLLGADTALEQASLDKYTFVRNFYLQRRLSQVYDGNPPRPKDDDADDDGAKDAAPATDKKEKTE